MIINKYDLDRGVLDEEIIREIKHLVNIISYCSDYNVLELKFSVKKIKNEGDNYI